MSPRVQSTRNTGRETGKLVSVTRRHTVHPHFSSVSLAQLSNCKREQKGGEKKIRDVQRIKGTEREEMFIYLFMVYFTIFQ